MTWDANPASDSTVLVQRPSSETTAVPGFLMPQGIWRLMEKHQLRVGREKSGFLDKRSRHSLSPAPGHLDTAPHLEAWACPRGRRLAGVVWGLQARQGHHEGRGRAQGPPAALDPQVRTDAWRPVLKSARLRKDSRLETVLLCWRPRDGPCALSGPEGDRSVSQPLGPARGPSSREASCSESASTENRK